MMLVIVGIKLEFSGLIWLFDDPPKYSYMLSGLYLLELEREREREVVLLALEWLTLSAIDPKR